MIDITGWPVQMEEDSQSWTGSLEEIQLDGKGYTFDEKTRQVHIDDVSIVPHSKHIIFIRNLKPNFDPAQVEEFLKDRIGGPVRTVFNPFSQSIAIRFDDPEKAAIAVTSLNRTVMLGSIVEIEFYKNICAFAKRLARRHIRLLRRTRSRSPIFTERRELRESRTSRELPAQRPNQFERSEVDRSRHQSREPVYRGRSREPEYRGQSREPDYCGRSREPDGFRRGRSRERTERRRNVRRSRSRKSMEAFPVFVDDVVDLTGNDQIEDEMGRKQKMNPNLTPIRRKTLLKTPEISSQDITYNFDQPSPSPLPPPGLVQVNTKFSVGRFGQNGASNENHDFQLFHFVDNLTNSTRLRLGTVAFEQSIEAVRNEKMSKIPSEIRIQVERKIDELKEELKNDTTTFGFVFQLLVNKDPGLETRLKLALMAVLNDLNDGYNKKMNEIIDCFFSN